MNPAQRFRPPPLRFGEQNRKIFLTFFNRLPPNFFSIKETKNFLFCPPTLAGIAETLLPHSPPAWAEFIPYNPEGICAGASNFFWRRKNFKAKRVVDGFRKIKNFSYTLSLAPLENKVLHLSIFLISFIIIDEKRQNVQ